MKVHRLAATLAAVLLALMGVAGPAWGMGGGSGPGMPGGGGHFHGQFGHGMGGFPHHDGFHPHGRFVHDFHDGHVGWWWIAGGFWYPWYPAPVYTGVGSYYCQSAAAYYPNVTTCPEGWLLVVAPAPAF